MCIRDRTICVCNSYSTGPGIYGSKWTESKGEAWGQGLLCCHKGNPYQLCINYCINYCLKGQIYSHNFPCSLEGTNYDNKVHSGLCMKYSRWIKCLNIGQILFNCTKNSDESTCRCKLLFSYICRDLSWASWAVYELNRCTVWGLYIWLFHTIFTLACVYNQTSETQLLYVL